MKSKRVSVSVLTTQEFSNLTTWFSTNKSMFPDEISALFARILQVYLVLSTLPNRAKEILARLREAMGIVPKSERGVTALGKFLRG